MTEQQLELLLPDYIDEAVIKTPPYYISRVSAESGRHYMVRSKDSDEESEPIVLPSITTIIRNTSPLSPFIIDKMIQMGKEAWGAYLEERADYGTNLHIIIGYFIRNKSVKIPFEREVVDDIGMNNRGFNHKVFFKFEQDTYSDLLSFCAFFNEYQVEPLALELPLASANLGFAGTLDMPCKMTLRVKGYWGEVYKTGPQKGSMKESYNDVRVIGLVDFKSGRHGFYRDNELQLKMAEMLFREHYPELCDEFPVKLFNWSPKEWRTEPSFLLTEQTDKVMDLNIKSRVSLFFSEYGSNPKKRRLYEGVLELGQPTIGLYYDQSDF
jgi:hypothetical protein